MDGPTAFANRDAPYARWAQASLDAAGESWPLVQPTFGLSATDTIFTMGSCFARNIEEHLARLGCRIPMMDFRIPIEEWAGRPAGVLNKFTPPAFRESLEWTARVHDRDGTVIADDCLPFMFEVGEDKYLDLDILYTPPVSKARSIERRQQMYDVFSSVFSAQCFVMTPGYIETWVDTRTGLHAAGVLKLKSFLRNLGRFKFEVRSYQACLDDLLKSIDIVRDRNPDVKVLVTTSPVPLAVTFTGQDIRIANSYSKSVLRAVCGALPMLRSNVDYFPSYESAMFSSAAKVWADDNIHVHPSFVTKIAAKLLSVYVEDVPESAQLVQEARLLLTSDMEGAYRLADRACAVDPTNIEARIVRGIAAVETAPDRAHADLIFANDAGYDTHEVRLGILKTLAALGRVSEACEASEAMLEAPQLNYIDFKLMVRRQIQAGNLARAEELARLCITKWPTRHQAYKPLVTALRATDRSAEVIEVLLTMRSLQSGHGVPLAQTVLLARLLMDHDRFKDAKAYVKILRESDPAHREVIRYNRWRRRSAAAVPSVKATKGSRDEVPAGSDAWGTTVLDQKASRD